MEPLIAANALSSHQRRCEIASWDFFFLASNLRRGISFVREDAWPGRVGKGVREREEEEEEEEEG